MTKESKQKGRALRSYRKKRGVNQKQLADAAGFAHKSAISRRERGEIEMSDKKFLELCTVIECIVEEREYDVDVIDLVL